MRRVVLVVVAMALCARGEWTSERVDRGFGTFPDWLNESHVVYQIVTDRFSRGEIFGKYEPSCGAAIENDYCGGTFKGIEVNIPYLTTLGVDVIWISPVTANIDRAYHGYYPTDLYKINENFGTTEDLKSLVSACHKAGIKVMVDVVANHMGSKWEDLLEGRIAKPFDELGYYHDCFGCGTRERWAHKHDGCGVTDYTNGTMMEHCRLFGLPDLDQDHPQVRSELLSWISSMVKEYEFDALRVDTVQYVKPKFWREFLDSAGVFATGEVADGRVQWLAQYADVMPSLLNFPLYYTMLDCFVKGMSMQALPRRLREMRSHGISGETGKRLHGFVPANFIENADQPRLTHYQKDLHQLANAMVMLLTIEGIPVMYYGSELAVDFSRPVNFTEFALTHTSYSGTDYGYEYRYGGYGYEEFQVYPSAKTLPGTGNAIISPTIVSDGWKRRPMWEWFYDFENDPMSQAVGTQAHSLVRNLILFRKRSKFYEHDMVHLHEDDDVFVFARGRVVVVLSNLGGGSQVLWKRLAHKLPWNSGEVVCNLVKVAEYGLLWNTVCKTVESNAEVYFQVDGSPQVWIPQALVSYVAPPIQRIPWISWNEEYMGMVWIGSMVPFVLFGVWLAYHSDVRKSKKRDVIECDVDSFLDIRKSENGSRRVLFASLEHDIPDHGIKVKAGGLGSVMKAILDWHPGPISMATMAVNDVDYPCGIANYKVSVMVNGTEIDVEVHVYSHRADEVRIFVFDCELFRKFRSRNEIYPQDLDTLYAAKLYSAWNQCISQLIIGRTGCWPIHTLYHACDYHGALAPIYALRESARFSMVLSLHNAEYTSEWRLNDVVATNELASIFNLHLQEIEEFCDHTGCFNMLYAAVRYIEKYQKGIGALGVSIRYARRCHTKYDIFWKLPFIIGVPNPFVRQGGESKEEISRLSQSLHLRRIEGRDKLQHTFELEPLNRDTRIFMFVGRMTYQKGVDLIADVAPWLVQTYDARLLVFGPPGDMHGRYAADKLCHLSVTLPGKIVCVPRFYQVQDWMRDASNFCLMPSRDEPFGYVDLEFAARGTPCVGAMVGGLGKIPGFYYMPTAITGTRLLSQLKDTIKAAMDAPNLELEDLGTRAIKCTFPVKNWLHALKKTYSAVEETHRSELPQVDSRAPSKPLNLETFPLEPNVEKESLLHVLAVERDDIETLLLASTSLKRKFQRCQDELLQNAKSRDELFRSSKFANVCMAEFVQDPGIITTIMREEEIESQHRSSFTKRSIEKTYNIVDALRLASFVKIARLHVFNWIVALGYILAIPTSQLFTIVSFLFLFDPSTTSEIEMAFGRYQGVYALGVLGWVYSSWIIPANKLISLSLLGQGLSFSMFWLILRFCDDATWIRYYALVISTTIHALNAAASIPICVGMNFLEDTHRGMHVTGVRVATIELVRNLLAIPIVYSCAATFPQRKDEVAPSSVLLEIGRARIDWASSILFYLAMLCFTGSFMALHGLPKLYQKLSFHGKLRKELELVFSRQTFRVMVIAQSIGAFSAYASSLWLFWLRLMGWDLMRIVNLLLLKSIAQVVLAPLIGYCTAILNSYNPKFIAFFNVAVVPPVIVRSFAIYTLDASSSPEGIAGIFSHPLTFLFLLTCILEDAENQTKSFMLQQIFKRQQYILASGVILVATGIIQVLSVGVGSAVASLLGASFQSNQPNRIAAAILVSTVPFRSIQYALEFWVIPRFTKESLLGP